MYKATEADLPSPSHVGEVAPIRFFAQADRGEALPRLRRLKVPVGRLCRSNT